MSRNLKEMGDEPCAYLGGALKVKGSKPGQKWVYTWNVPEAPRWTMELGPAHSLQWSERRFWRSQQVRFLIDDLKDVALPGGGGRGECRQWIRVVTAALSFLLLPCGHQNLAGYWSN